MVAVDVVLFTVKDDRLHVLLMKMKKHPFENAWAAPGGMVQADETPLDAAVRQLKERTGLGEVYLEQLFTFGDVNRDPFGRVISIAHMALVPSNAIDGAVGRDVAWFPVDKLPELAYDHAAMITTAVGRLKAKLSYTNISMALLPEKFPLSHLQHVYECILGAPIDKRNFIKRIQALGIVAKTREFEKNVPYRPAQLYKFKHRTLTYVDLL